MFPLFLTEGRNRVSVFVFDGGGSMWARSVVVVKWGVLGIWLGNSIWRPYGVVDRLVVIYLWEKKYRKSGGYRVGKGQEGLGDGGLEGGGRVATGDVYLPADVHRGISPSHTHQLCTYNPPIPVKLLRESSTANSSFDVFLVFPTVFFFTATVHIIAKHFSGRYKPIVRDLKIPILFHFT